jgi:hypothetical protein
MTRGSADHGDEHHERGACGETHQIATGDRPTLTTQQGTQVADDQNTATAGSGGSFDLSNRAPQLQRTDGKAGAARPIQRKPRVPFPDLMGCP